MSDARKHLDKWSAYIESHARRTKQRQRDSSALDPAVTLSRLSGAGATTLAERLVDHLNAGPEMNEPAWTVFDKNLINEVLKDHNLPDYLAQFMPEDKPRQIEDVIGDMLGMHPPNFKLVQNIGETIYRIAKMGRAIIIGRGANIITEDLPNVLHLRLVGSLENRVRRCMQFYKMTESEARLLIAKQDRARRRYVLAYYDREIEDPLNYHQVINVDRYTTEQLVEVVGNMLATFVAEKTG
jgi:cytidylate kinase